ACHRFEANQFRLLLHSAAYVLLETLRREVLRTTQWASATMETIQLRLLKLGARVHEVKDRITIALPSSCPVAPVLRRSLTLLACVRLTSTGPVKRREERHRFTCDERVVSPKGLPGRGAPERDDETYLCRTGQT